MRVVVNPAEIRKLDSREILGPKMLTFAQKARDQAQRIAPKDSGEYAATLFARKSRGRFSTCIYGSDRFYARFIEWGSRTTPPKKEVTKATQRRRAKRGYSEWKIKPHHTLLKAAIDVGMRVRGARF